MRHNHRRVQRSIDTYFVKGLSPGARSRLFNVLEACTACGAYFDRCQELEGALMNESPPTALLLERMEASLIPGSAPAGRMVGRGVLVPGLAAGALLSVLAILLWIWLAVPGSRDANWQKMSVDMPMSELVPRGSVHSDSNRVGFRLFRVAPDGLAVDESKRLSPGDTVTFSATSMESQFRYLSLLAVQGEQVLWFYPLAEDSDGQQIPSPVVDHPLGHGFRMTPGLDEGEARFIALFSTTPLDKESVETIAVEAKAGYNEARPLSELFPDGQVLEYSVGVTLE